MDRAIPSPLFRPRRPSAVVVFRARPVTFARCPLGTLGLVAVAAAWTALPDPRVHGALNVAAIPALHRCLVWDLPPAMASCGTLQVAENRTIEGGRRIALNIVVLPARRQPSASDPIVVLTGGPGLPAATQAWLFRSVEAAREWRDVVLVDQRGTGGSAPLACPIDDDGKQGPAYLGRLFPAAAVPVCRQRLATHADVTRYTTEDAVDDMDDVRASLGYDQLNIVGLSYGTRVALTYLRRHEDHVRSMILHGTTPPGFTIPLPAAAGGDRALRRLFADCAADNACRRAFPKLEDEYRAVVARLTGAPVTVMLYGASGALSETVTLTGPAFAEAVWSRLSSTGRASLLPLAIHRMAAGHFREFVDQQLRENRARRRQRSDGAMLAVLCAEDAPQLTRELVAEAGAASLVGAPLAADVQDACIGWPRRPMPADFRSPVRSAVAALVISGELDPLSPPTWGENVSRGLTNSRHVVLPVAGHVDDSSCALGLISAFIARPDPQALNASCSTGMKRPPFALR